MPARKLSSGRLLWADAIRALATYFVICVHLTYMVSPISGKNFIDTALFSLIKTCVPLFAALSGGLLLSKSDTILHFLSKRLSRLLTPWVLWTSLYTGIFLLKNHIFFNISIFARQELIQLFTLLWFVPIIIGLYIVTPLFRFLFHKKHLSISLFYIGVWFVTLTLFPRLYEDPLLVRTNNSMLFLQVLLYSGYYLWGDVVLRLKKTILLEKQYTLSLVLLFIGIFWTFAKVLHGGGGGSYHYLSGNIILLTLGVYWLLYLFFSHSKFPNFFVSHIAHVSKLSFGILFLHIFIIQFVLKDILLLLPDAPYFFSALFLLLISYAVLWQVAKVNLFKKLLV